MTDDSLHDLLAEEMTPADYAAEAAALERKAEEHPEEAEMTLIAAAEDWGLAGEHERALALFDRILPDSDVPQFVRAVRLDALWHVRGEEASRTAAAELRREKSDDPEVWSEVANVFQQHGDLSTAVEWWSAGITHFLGPEPDVDVEAVMEWGPELEALFHERHVARHELGLAHDGWDEVSSAIEELYEAEEGGLDDDPMAVDEAPADAPGMVLPGEDAAPDPEAPRTPRRTGLLYWRGEQFAEVVHRWPETIADYGEDHAEYVRALEHALRRNDAEGPIKMSIVTGDIDELVAYAEARDESPADLELRSRFAVEKADRGEALLWPPERNAPCWCGSERKYKKCCGGPAPG